MSMPRQRRYTPAGMVFHVINRGVGRQTIFHKDEDYAAFERVMAEAWQRIPVRILSYCLMPNHWHFVLWPRRDDEVSEFTKWLTHTHTQRWHAHYHTSGTGHLYQGRFKSFPVKDDVHLLLVLRYVERNALRANLVARAEDWTWGSLWRRAKGRGTVMLSEWPVDRPMDWVNFVNEPQSQSELEALRRSVNHGCPFGDEDWQKEVAEDLGLQSTLRPRGRPRKVGASCGIDP
jgi:putative transposase